MKPRIKKRKLLSVKQLLKGWEVHYYLGRARFVFPLSKPYDTETVIKMVANKFDCSPNNVKNKIIVLEVK